MPLESIHQRLDSIVEVVKASLSEESGSIDQLVRALGTTSEAFAGLGIALLERNGKIEAERAISFFEDGLFLRDRLLALDPDDIPAMHAVLACLHGLMAALHTLSGHLADSQSPADQKTLASCTDRFPYISGRILELAEKLLAADPDDEDAKFQVADAASHLADYLEKSGIEGDVEKATFCIRRSLEIREQVLIDDPANVENRMAVVKNLKSLGTRLSDPQEPLSHAIECLERSVDILRPLLAEGSDLTEPGWKADALGLGADCFIELADALLKRNELKDAERSIVFFESALFLREQLLALDLEDISAMHYVMAVLYKLCSLLVEDSASYHEKYVVYLERMLEVAQMISIMKPDDEKAMAEVEEITTFLEELRAEAKDFVSR